MWIGRLARISVRREEAPVGAEGARTEMTFEERKQTIDFIRANRLGRPGAYRYSASCDAPTLYASSYAAMTLHLLDGFQDEDLDAWRAYLQGFQQADGLFGDPVIFNQGWYEGDPLWCGRPHLTCHVLTALACLGGAAEKPIVFLRPWKDADFLIRWLDGRDWKDDVANTGNEIMNIANLLQYERDFRQDPAAAKAVETILDWLSEHRVSKQTGLWGDLSLEDPLGLSNSVQAAYHWWAVFFYDRRGLPYQEQALRQLLRTQNPEGGFGWGVHHPQKPWLSSACEDIDSLDPICRIYASDPERYSALKSVIARGRDAVARNRAMDGGMVFYREDDFEYGHPQLKGTKNEGAMFPTWFRTLTLAVCDTALGTDKFSFIRCPGYQFSL